MRILRRAIFGALAGALLPLAAAARWVVSCPFSYESRGGAACLAGRLAVALVAWVVAVAGSCGDGGGASSGPKLSIQTPASLSVEVGELVDFVVVVQGRPSSEVTVEISPVPLPENTAFDEAMHHFVMLPAPGQEGTYDFTFSARAEGSVAHSRTRIRVSAANRSATWVSGQVLDSDSAAPLPGVQVTVLPSGATASTSADGRFSVRGIDPADNQIRFDGSTTTAPGGDRATVIEDLDLVLSHMPYENANNMLPREVFLPRLGPSAGKVDPNATTVLEGQAAGVVLTIPSGAARDRDTGALYDGDIYIPQVRRDRTPAALPAALQPGLVIAIQPPNIEFTTPAPLTFPNVDQLDPGTQLELWSISPISGSFEKVGEGIVTSDGSQIITGSGGVRNASWHFFLPKPPGLGEDRNDMRGPNDQNHSCVQVGSEVDPQTGGLTVSYMTPGYRTFQGQQSVVLVYSSRTAAPYAVVSATMDIDPFTSLPEAFATALDLGGVKQPGRLYYESTSDPLRASYGVAAPDMPTGVYKYAFTGTSVYTSSEVSARFTGESMLYNRSDSPVGRGWGIADVSRLQEVDPERVLLLRGDGSIMMFRPSAAGGGHLQTELVFALDGSGSISASDWLLQLEGIAGALEDPAIIPRDGSAAIGVVQFASYSREEIPLTVIDSESTALALAADVRSIPQMRGGTCMSCGIDTARDMLVPGTSGAKQVICLSTDGRPNDPTATINAANAAVAAGVDEISAIGVGPGADMQFLAQVVRGGGFAEAVATFEEYGFAVGRKLGLLVSGAPPGDFSRMVRNTDGTITRELPDRSVEVYDQNGFLVRREDSLGNRVEYEYDPSGRLLRRRDPTGRETQFVYNSSGRIVRIIEPGGRETVLSYNAAGDLIRITDPAKHSREFRYDAEGRLIEQRRASGSVVRYRYDDIGALIETVREDGKHVSIQASVTATLPEGLHGRSLQDPLPAINPDSIMAVVQEQDKARTALRADSLGLPLVEEVFDGEIVSYVRDNNGLPTRIERPDIGPVEQVFDGRGNLVRRTRLGDEGTSADDRVELWSYVPGTSWLTRYENSSEPSGLVGMTITRDANGLPLTVEWDDGRVVSYSYDEQGRGVAGLAGLVTSIQFGAGTDAVSMYLTYGDLGLPVEIEYPNGRLEKFSYGADGQVVHYESNQGAESLDIAYDADGLPIEYRSAVGAFSHVTYDPDHRRQSVKSASGREIQYTYDARGRTVRITYGLGDVVISYGPNGYDQTVVFPDGHTAAYIYDDWGRLMRVEERNDWAEFTYLPGGLLLESGRNPSGRIGFTYNAHGELASEDFVPDNPELHPWYVSSAYDKAGRRTEQNGHINGVPLAQLRFAYGSGTQIQSIESSAYGRVAFAYNTGGRLMSAVWTIGGQLVGSITNTWQNGALAMARLDGSPGQYAEIQFVRSTLGYISGEIHDSSLLGQHTVNWTYDDTGRIAGVSYDGVSVWQATYDLDGNRYPQGGTSWKYGAASELLESDAGVYTYDGSGMCTSKGLGGLNTTFQYGIGGNVTKIDAGSATVEIDRDALGRILRIHQVGGGGDEQHWAYHGRQRVAALHSNGTLREYYWRGLDAPVLVGSSSGSELLVSGANGGVAYSINESGSVVYGRIAEPLGATLDQAGSTASNAVFRGRPGVNVAGSMYVLNRARVYGVAEGRFLGFDWWDQETLQWLGASAAYSYGRNIPEVDWDPSGQTVWEQLLGKALGAAGRWLSLKSLNDLTQNRELANGIFMLAQVNIGAGIALLNPGLGAGIMVAGLLSWAGTEFVSPLLSDLWNDWIWPKLKDAASNRGCGRAKARPVPVMSPSSEWEYYQRRPWLMPAQ